MTMAECVDANESDYFIQAPNDDVAVAALQDQAAALEEQREVDGIADSFENSEQVKWRGNLVTEKEAKALAHVFDNLQDHFGHQRPDPRISFNTTSFAYSDHERKWYCDLDFKYNVGGDNCKLAYIGIDACVDLTPKLVHKNGQPMLKDYGKSWVYVYLPEPTYEQVKAYVKVGTGWDVSTDDESIVHDPNRDLVAIEAKIHNQGEDPKPSFWVLQDKDTSGGNNFPSFSRIGTVQDVAARSGQQRVHRGVAIFSVSMEVEGTPNFKPSPGLGHEANLKFTLVSIRTWGITECVGPIVHAPNKYWY